MRLIDPFEFRDMFPAVRSVAVVGNAPCILDWKCGATIDSHDMVVRFNRARTDGLEELIGSRTDVLFVNAANSLAKAPTPTETTKPRCLVCLVSPQGSRDFDSTQFREWVGDLPVLISFGPDLIGFPSSARTKPLTSGTYALFTLLRLFDVEKLFVTGFTMFGAVAGGADKYYADANLAPAHVHDLDQEASLFAAILERFQGELTATEEVLALARGQGFQLAGNGAANGAPRTLRRSLRNRLADGIAWRLLKLGMKLRRIAQVK